MYLVCGGGVMRIHVAPGQDARRRPTDLRHPMLVTPPHPGYRSANPAWFCQEHGENQEQPRLQKRNNFSTGVSLKHVGLRQKLRHPRLAAPA